MLSYAEPALHTVTPDGQAVTGGMDEMVVEEAAYVPLAQVVHSRSVVRVADKE